MWRVKHGFLKNGLPRTSQLKFLTGCTCICWIKVDLYNLRHLPHTSHLYTVCRICYSIWEAKVWGSLNTFFHKLHIWSIRCAAVDAESRQSARGIIWNTFHTEIFTQHVKCIWTYNDRNRGEGFLFKNNDKNSTWFLSKDINCMTYCQIGGYKKIHEMMRMKMLTSSTLHDN